MESLTQEQIKHRLGALKKEHAELDSRLKSEQKHSAADMIRIQRLKKRKLALKDEITQLENMLLPDIIA